ncbi:putative cytochrome b5-like heme/steroid binding domain-containing protein [Helianthus debilis subsp. tardiflorus]
MIRFENVKEEDGTILKFGPKWQKWHLTLFVIKKFTNQQDILLLCTHGYGYHFRMFYGPGGPYALFAGKDASRALAKMSFEEKDLNGDLTGLGVFELEALQDWEYKFMSKYVKVGTIKKPEPAPEPSTNDQPAEPSATEPAEPSAAEPAEPSATEPAEPSATEPAEPSAAKPAEPSATEPADHVPSEVAVGETKDETTSEANKHE